MKVFVGRSIVRSALRKTVLYYYTITNGLVVPFCFGNHLSHCASTTGKKERYGNDKFHALIVSSAIFTNGSLVLVSTVNFRPNFNIRNYLHPSDIKHPGSLKISTSTKPCCTANSAPKPFIPAEAGVI